MIPRLYKPLFSYNINIYLSVYLISIYTNILISLEPDEKKYKDHLESISFIGRFDSLNSVKLLLNYLETDINHFERYLATGPQSGVNIEQVSEELHWLLLIIGHLLADAGDSEVPMVPMEIGGVSKASSEGSGKNF